MRHAVVAVALLLAATVASAADLSISRSSIDDATGRPGDLLHPTFRILNPDPDAARDVRVTFTSNVPLVVTRISLTGGTCAGLECTRDSIAKNDAVFTSIVTRAPLTAGPVVITATVSASNDPNSTNNRADYEFMVIIGPDLYTSIQGIDTFDELDPEEKRTIPISAGNSGLTPATDVALTVHFTPGTEILAITGNSLFTCEISAPPVRCHAGTVPVGPAEVLRFRIKVPPLYGGGQLEVKSSVRGSETDIVTFNNDSTRTARIVEFFTVNTTADDGPGSLRQAIVDANAAPCVRACNIGFRIPGPMPPAGYFTIQPRSPLPPLNFRGAVKGAVQTNFLDLEPRTAPRIMLDGSLQPSGNGLTAHANSDVLDIAIGHFAGDAIRCESSPASRSGSFRMDIGRVFLGLDPAGRPAPNQRGVVDVVSVSSASLDEITISNSVIGGNRRSGVWIESRNLTLRDSRIGVAPDSAAPMPNGASGVFLPRSGFARIERNVIANHPEFGIALHAPEQRSIDISSNAIYNNRANGIDYGLDGPTPNAADDSLRFPNHPFVTSALAFPTSTTIHVSLSTWSRPSQFGRFDPGAPYFVHAHAYVDLYAGSGPHAQLELHLGRIDAGQLSMDRATSVTGSLLINRDLRGQWLTAVTRRRLEECYTDVCRYFDETSEASPPFRVP